jgi:signal transduction histidine kinase
MKLTEGRTRRSAEITFAVCVAFYLVDVLVPPFASMATGHGWYWNGSITDTVLGVMTLLFPVVGVLVARRQPRNAVGWVMLGVGIVASLPLSAYYEYADAVGRRSLVGADVAAALESAVWAPLLGLMGTILILLFPDGHLPSPRWRFVAWLSGFSIAYIYLAVTFSPGKVDQAGRLIDNPLALPLLRNAERFLVPSLALFPLSIVLCAAGLVVRFRRSTGMERLQLKWLTTAGAFVAVAYAIAMTANLAANGAWANGDPLWLQVIENTAVFSFSLIPVAIGVAILRHGLYDVDLVINKAVVFGLLAAFITVVYVAIVVGVARTAGGGDRLNIALSIAATSMVAVAFQPVRERVERFANRVVYGRRATPYEVLSDFADRLGGAFDAAALLPVMAQTVAEGVGANNVEVWLATHSGLVREASWPQEVGVHDGGARRRPDELSGDRVVEVRHHGELLGALSVTKPPGDSLRPAEVRLLDDVATQAGLVLRNTRLVEELRGSRERLMTIQDDERQRLERRLHDGAQRRLLTVASMIGEAREQVRPGGDAAAALEQLAGQLKAATEELGELARGIHPAVLTELGLGSGVRALAQRAPIPVGVEVQGERPLPRNVEATLYFVAAESLTNVAKHAHATSATVRLIISDSSASLNVTDDGIGGVDERRGSGVRGLADRVAAMDGSLDIWSPPGSGTRLTCRIPLSASAPPSDELALVRRSGR